MHAYVHGYHERENERLSDQAFTLADLLHGDTRYAPGERVLEVGCGVGAQTVFLAAHSPEAEFVSIDVSERSIEQARAAVRARGLANVQFRSADLMALTARDGVYDHAFVCFVLEHLADPLAALRHLAGLVRPGGTVTAIEGDHGSFYCHPETAAARRVVQCLVDLQARCGGDALIGRRLYPLLSEAGYRVRVQPRMVYVDAGRPDLVEGFSRRTFIAMVEGVRPQALASGLIDESLWDRGIRDLHRATAADGTFCYTFFKALARRPGCAEG